jgi:stress-induced morphogen
MSSTPTDFQGCASDALRAAIEQRIPHSRAAIYGANGRFSIDVTSPAFAGLSRLESQWLVYVAIGHLLQGAASPVRAVDSLQTRAPARIGPGFTRHAWPPAIEARQTTGRRT